MNFKKNISIPSYETELYNQAFDSPVGFLRRSTEQKSVFNEFKIKKYLYGDYIISLYNDRIPEGPLLFDDFLFIVKRENKQDVQSTDFKPFLCLVNIPEISGIQTPEKMDETSPEFLLFINKLINNVGVFKSYIYSGKEPEYGATVAVSFGNPSTLTDPIFEFPISNGTAVVSGAPASSHFNNGEQVEIKPRTEINMGNRAYHKLENLIYGQEGVKFLSSKKKRDLSSIDSIIIHQSGFHNRKQTEASLINDGYGVHFAVDPDGTIHQHVDLDRVTGHAVGRNDTSVGIEVNTRFTFDVKLKDKNPSKVISEHKVDSALQLLKSPIPIGATMILANVGAMESVFRAVTEVLKRCPNVKVEFPPVIDNEYYFFGHGEVNATGILPHGYQNRNRGDGRYTCLYVYLRLVKKMSVDAAYRRMLEISWASGGFASPEEGDSFVGSASGRKKIRKIKI